MRKPTKKQRVVSIATIAITTIGVLLGSVENTLAQEPQRTLAAPASQLTTAGLSVLENAFWVCDYGDGQADWRARHCEVSAAI
jgi:hypothetical protein